MPRKSKKQKQPFTISLGNRRFAITKPKLEWLVLAVLVVSAVGVQVSGLYPYVYNYARCGEAPLEVRGSYYRLSFDDTYGIHIGSDYSRCSNQISSDLQRDPATKAEIGKAKRNAAEAERLSKLTAEYDLYTPNGYKVSDMRTSPAGDGMETTFTVTTAAGHRFSVREMKKDSAFSYASLCSKPPEPNWSGMVIGRDTKGREICKTNLSKYVRDYIVGVNIGKTAIMLTERSNSPVEELNTDAIAMFSSMERSAANN